MEDPINGKGDPKNGEGVEMNLEIFFEGGLLSCYIKCQETLKMGGGQNFFGKKPPPLRVFLAPSLTYVFRTTL